MKILLAFLILAVPSFAFARVESRCFQNDTLQGKNSIVFDTNGNKVSGTFSVDKGDENISKTYEFTGIIAGSILRVKFDRIKFPDVSPSEMKSLDWTLVKVGDQEVLRIKFYGKNYETNKYADYFADFESCEPSYATLAKKAKVVQFAKGKNSQTASISLKVITSERSFQSTFARVSLLRLTRQIAKFQSISRTKNFTILSNGKMKTAVKRRLRMRRLTE